MNQYADQFFKHGSEKEKRWVHDDPERIYLHVPAAEQLLASLWTRR